MKHQIHLIADIRPDCRITRRLIAAANAGMTHTVVAKEANSPYEFEACFANSAHAALFRDALNARANNPNAYVSEII